MNHSHSLKSIRESIDEKRFIKAGKGSYNYSLDLLLTKLKYQFEEMCKNPKISQAPEVPLDKKKLLSKSGFYSLLSYLPTYITESLYRAFSSSLGQENLSFTEFSSPLIMLKFGSSDDISKIIFKVLDYNQVNMLSIQDINSFLDALEGSGKNCCKEIDFDLLRSASSRLYKHTNFNDFNEIIKKQNDATNIVKVVFTFLYESIHFYSSEFIQGKFQHECSKGSTEATLSSFLDQRISTENVALKDAKVKGTNTNKENSAVIEKLSKDIGKELIKPTRKGSDSIQNNVQKLLTDDLFPEQRDSTRGQDQVLKPPKKNSNKKVEEKLPKDLLVEAVSEPEENNEVIIEGKIWIIFYYEQMKKNYMKPAYLVLKNKHLYYYENKEGRESDKCLRKQSILETFVRINMATKVKDNNFESFSLFSNTSNVPEIFYHKEKEVIETWVKAIRKENNYENIFDKYKFIEEISIGGFGKICYSQEINGSAEVAVKVLNKFINGKSFIEEIRNEIEVLKMIDHPNIVKMIANYDNSVYSFIVFEYLFNGTLKELLKMKKSVEEHEIKPVALQIAKIVKYLHNMGIVHRDIKLSNIMLSNDSTTLNLKDVKIKLIDFGTCKVMNKEYKSNSCFGTIEYSAPESFKRGVFGKSNDIWSFGITLYHMMFGVLPFPLIEKNENDYAKRLLREELVFPKNHKCSKSFCDLVEKCLEKKHNNRITIEEVLNHPWFGS